MKSQNHFAGKGSKCEVKQFFVKDLVHHIADMLRVHPNILCSVYMRFSVPLEKDFFFD